MAESVQVEGLRVKWQELTTKTTALHAWRESLKLERQRTYEAVAADPVAAVKRLAEIDGQLAAAAEVSAALETKKEAAKLEMMRRDAWERSAAGRSHAARAAEAASDL